jgi:hypothetical protein
VREETYISTEKVYAAGVDLEDARQALENKSADNPQDAWDALGYWDREERPGDFEVYEFLTTTQVTRVSPPYTR